MSEENCLVVHAAGRQLDLLRDEAFRIARGANVGWWTDRAEVGTKFCFEAAAAKKAFAVACDNLGISHKDG